jgi:mitochondrial fission protein ELM1
MITAWAVTTGEAGMRTQARGLARAVADRVIERTAPSGWLQRWSDVKTRDVFYPPWPDILITCGRRSARFGMFLSKRMPRNTLTVHIQDPRAPATAFDLIVAMEHDRISAGGNVIKVATALHDVTPEDLAKEAEAWRERLSGYGHPLTGVMIGGSTARQAFTLDHGRRLLTGLRRLRAAGIGLAVIPSRRTPGSVNALLSQAFAGDPKVFVWDLKGDNPYRAVLALADRLVVTSDSVSMISEALATCSPVDIFDFGTTHYGRFMNRMTQRGWARRFDGDAEPPPPRPPINATEEAAAAVRELLQARTGMLGKASCSRAIQSSVT